eukprot:SAG11_NODE_3132_length_2664_cov_1.502924_2_plen_161_part_00
MELGHPSRCLRYVRVPGATQAAIAQVAQRGVALRTLELSGCATLDDAALAALGAAGSATADGLRVLDVSGCTALTEVFLAGLPRSLEELNLSGCRRITCADTRCCAPSPPAACVRCERWPGAVGIVRRGGRAAHAQGGADASRLARKPLRGVTAIGLFRA